MQAGRTSHQAETLFRGLERNAQNPLKMYRCLLGRAAVQLDRRAAECAALQAEVKGLRKLTGEQDKELEELRLRLAQVVRKEKKRQTRRQQRLQECGVARSPTGVAKGTAPASAHARMPGRRRDAHTPPESQQQQQEEKRQQQQQLESSLTAERIFCEVLLTVMGDAAAAADGLGDPPGAGETCLGRAALSAVRSLKAREASLRGRIGELEEALRGYEKRRMEACASAERDAVHALETIPSRRARDESWSRDRGPKGMECAEDSGAKSALDDLCGEEEVMEYEAWKYDFLEKLMSSE